ncbi:MAG: hypothetical protein FWH53_00695 [Leptospirales bacterium]|nr:hypothetical protein [Leptospirales bacterium]
MRVISMKLINQVMELKEKNKISTKAAMDMLAETGVCKAGELPDVSSMDAIIKGIKAKRNKGRKAYGSKNRNTCA